MKSSATLMSVDIDKLILDKDNPRFAELYNGSSKEEDIIQYLLYEESAEDIVKALVAADEFYPDRPLWVLEQKGKYLVKDGNRRGAAAKALQFPRKYGLSEKKMPLKQLPVLLYSDPKEIDRRILLEHTSNLFKQWGRIAKALEIHRLYSSGSSLSSLNELDSAPSQLYKLAGFYYEAVKIGGENLKKLLRSGRGKTGGKTIIFERLFPYSDVCGYKFRRSPSYEIQITDSALFRSYIKALVEFLLDKPDTKTSTVDGKKKAFLKELIPYGFSSTSTSSTSNDGSTSSSSTASSSSSSSSTDTPASKSTKSSGKSASSSGTGKTGKSVKTKPEYFRLGIHAPLDNLIQECYNLSELNFPNAKMAIARVSFECTLKYIVEQTKQSNGKPLSVNNYFRNAYFDNKGKKRPYTHFDNLKANFTQLIADTGIRKSFESFDLDNIHQIIHNYNVAAIPSDAKGTCDNLLPLIEFMLQTESDLLSSLDLSKLK